MKKIFLKVSICITISMAILTGCCITPEQYNDPAQKAAEEIIGLSNKHKTDKQKNTTKDYNNKTKKSNKK